MKMKSLKLSLLLGAAVGAMNLTALAGPGPGTWPTGFPTVVKSKAEAMACCLPKEKVALACKDCKTVNEKGGEDKKGVAAWFAPEDKHDCSGCGGKITVTATGGGKGPTLAEYTHVCSKCGDKSAYTCATHVKKS
jgi:hypothetical protein